MDIFKIIKCDGNDCGNDVFVWKFPGEDFNTLSQLIVHESQEAVFFKDGKALDLFGAGRYTLHSQNIPLIRRLVNLPFNGESPFHCEVYFINKAVSMNLKWGTPTPLQIEDCKYHIMIPVRMFGQFAVQVEDSKKLLLKLVGTTSVFTQKTLGDYFKGILLTNIRDYVAKMLVQKQISILEIQSHLKAISNGIAEDIKNEFSIYGLKLVNFNVNEISVPEDDPSYVELKKAKSQRAKMDIIGYNYQQERMFGVLDKAAANEGTSSAVMGAGMGLGMGVNIGSAVGTAMGNGMSDLQPDSQNNNMVNIKCAQCGAQIPEGSKFCPECGAKVVAKGKILCPQCGAEIPEGAKFCLECGAKLIHTCPKCGAETVQGAKFCLECGEKLI